MFKAINAPSIRDLFIREVESMILSGKLAIGERLPTERELAEQMKISKTAINSGLQELSRRGFLDIRPRQGIFVADYAKYGTLETLNSIMTFHGGRLDEKNEKSILEIRLLLQGPAIERAALERTDEDLSFLQELIDEAKEILAQNRLGMVRAVARIHYQFHHHISFISGNSITPLIFNAFKPSTLALWEEASRIRGVDTCLKDLQRLLGFIAEKQSRQAREFLERMIRDYMEGKGYR